MKRPIRKQAIGSKRKPKKRAPETGPKTVRAWFDTVMNPLLRALESEDELLRSRNWTWRFRPGALEMLRRTESYLDPEVRDNLEQIKEDYSAMKVAVDEHDRNVEQLSRCCEQLHKALVQSQDLKSTYERTTSSDSLSRLGAVLAELFGAYPQHDHLELLAQYIVNNTGQLPSYYSPSRLWNTYHDEFLDLLDRPGIRPQHEMTVETGEALRRSAERLRNELRTTRHRLSREHDVPYVSSERLRDKAAGAGFE